MITFGHGTASQQQIIDLLRGADVRAVVDIRTAPGSRRNPHVVRAELQRWLPEHGIAYRWERRLGGFRKPPADSPDVFWREEMFRGYAAHMRTTEFDQAVTELLTQAGATAPAEVAVMCAESLWWRCHRRLLADALVLVYGVTVRHLMHDGRLVAHEPSAGVRRRPDGLLVYDCGPGGSPHNTACGSNL